MEKLLGIAASEDDVKIRLDAIKTALSRGGFGDRNTVEVETVSKDRSGFDAALGLVKVRRGPREGEQPATDAEVVDTVDAVVVEEVETRTPIGRPTRPTPAPSEARPSATRVNSDSTPPAHIARRTPGYTSGQRRSDSRVER